MQPRNYGMRWKNLLVLLLLLPAISACSILQKPEPEVVVRTKIVEKKIPLQTSPKPISLNHPDMYVVTAENWDEFIEKFKKDNGQEWVFYAISVRGYETLSLNIAEMRRYLEQQKSIILYYEQAITGTPEEDVPVEDSSIE